MGFLRPIDRIWAVGESYHLREKGPGDGCTLLMWGWYLDAILPLWSFARRLDAGWIAEAILFPGLAAVPFVFCRVRYTPQRRKALLTRIRCKHPGRDLLRIWTGMAGIAGIECFLLLHFGIWEIGRAG